MKNRTNLFVNFNKFPNYSFFTPSRANPVEYNSETNLKVFIVQSSPILCPCSSHSFEYNLHLKHPFGEENTLPSNITKNTRSPVTYRLSMDT